MDARKAAQRDQKQRDFMVVEQIKERRALQRQFKKLRRKHAEERKLLASKMRQSLSPTQSSPPTVKRRGRDLGLSR